MPFTYVAFVVAALALAAFPGFSGYFSKDEILAFAAERGGGYWILYVAGTVAALMTAFYAFRIVFRVFGGEPNEEARELERGHLHHADPVNPMTGEPEDTDVGYPGPGAPHRRARAADAASRWRSSRSCPCSPACSRSRASRTWSRTSSSRRSRTRASSTPTCRAASRRSRWWSAALSVAGGHRPRLAPLRAAARARPCGSPQRFRGLHDFLAHKWYFDELYDRAIVRPTLALGGVVVERVRALRDRRHGRRARRSRCAPATTLVRVAQSGLLRYYALLLLTGVTALALYFLVVSR